MSIAWDEFAFVVGATIVICVGVVEIRGCDHDENTAKVEIAKANAAAAGMCSQSQRPAAECALIIHETSKQ